MNRIITLISLAAAVSLGLAWSAFASAAPAAGSDEVVNRINKAINEAESKLGASSVVEEVRKDIRKNLTHPSAKAAPAPKQAPPPLSARITPPTSVPVEAETAQPQIIPMKFKSADPKKQSRDLAWQSAGTYFHKAQYLEAHELAEEALKLDPQNRMAKGVQARISRDIRERPMDVGGMDRTITPPEGRVALAVAMSDGVVTLAEAEDTALKSSLMLESLRHRVAGAQGKVNEATRAFFPTAGVEASGGGGRISSTANLNGNYYSQRYMLNFSQPVFYGGELVFTLRQAKANHRAEELKYQKERTEVLRQTGEAFRSAVNALHNLDYQLELYGRISDIKKRHDKAFEAKLVAEIEHLEISSIFNQVAFQKETAITTQKSANLAICQAMGVKADQVIPVDPVVELASLSSIDLEEYLTRVGLGNFDIRIKQATLESAYYGVRVYDAQRLPRVDVRGNWGLSGEVNKPNWPGFDREPDNFSADEPDLEHEQAIIANVAIPWGPNTTTYSYQRRFFAPTVSTFQGSEDYKHSVTTNLFDRLSGMTDEEVAKAEYLKAMAELQKERTDQEIAARQAYYDYQSAVLQLSTSESKILFRERQVKILEQTVRMEEAKLTELLGELVSLAEDKFSKITAVSNANNAVAKMSYLAGNERINKPYEIQSAQ